VRARGHVADRHPGGDLRTRRLRGRVRRRAGLNVTDEQAIGAALDVARSAGAEGDVPVGAVVLAPDGTLLAAAHNTRERDADPAGHAEIVALRTAGRALGSWHLDGCTLAVTLEPCTMCAGAVVLARVQRLVFGAWDPKAGAVGSLWDVVRDRRLNHRPEVVGGIRAAECGELLTEFFRQS
jgi:tRNA(adenine34) deaminase